MIKVHVLRDWTKSYDPALNVARGDPLFVVKEDNKQWAGWIWCTNANGLSGWLPIQVFDGVKIGANNITVMEFDTVELSVSTGEILLIHNRLNDWSWCKNQRDQAGWVPDNCLRFPVDAA